MASMDFGARATHLFAEARRKVEHDCRGMHADHSARGLLASGNTIIRAVEIFGTRSGEALDQSLVEIAARIDHRGRRWSAAMAQVGEALDDQIAAAPALLESSFKLAGADIRTGAERAGLGKIDEAGAELRHRLASFRDGWTSPAGKPWRERHATVYAVLLLLCGAVAGQGVKVLLPASPAVEVAPLQGMEGARLRGRASPTPTSATPSSCGQMGGLSCSSGEAAR